MYTNFAKKDSTFDCKAPYFLEIFLYCCWWLSKPEYLEKQRDANSVRLMAPETNLSTCIERKGMKTRDPERKSEIPHMTTAYF